MVVKRVSYLSFLVALTAMAAVLPCYASGEPNASATNTAPQVINKGIATCFDKIVRAFDYSFGVTRSFKENTLKSGKLITAHAALRYNTVPTNLKFSTHQAHQLPPSLLPSPGYEDDILAECVSFSPGYTGLQSALDMRAEIEQKNRILQE